ncbi:hypothetical protein N806_19810 [Rhodococcus sp. P27]|nr:hypothetical protein N806_19810 [Rhodococcus sp. P27]
MLGSGDQGVGQCSGFDVDHEVVDGKTVASLHDVEGEDVCAHGSESYGERAEAAGSVGQLDAKQVRHVRAFR